MNLGEQTTSYFKEGYNVFIIIRFVDIIIKGIPCPSTHFTSLFVSFINSFISGAFCNQIPKGGYLFSNVNEYDDLLVTHLINFKPHPPYHRVVN